MSENLRNSEKARRSVTLLQHLLDAMMFTEWGDTQDNLVAAIQAEAEWLHLLTRDSPAAPKETHG